MEGQDEEGGAGHTGSPGLNCLQWSGVIVATSRKSPTLGHYSRHRSYYELMFLA